MESQQPRRLLPLVLLLAMLFSVDALSSGLHPVVLVPGNTCGQLDARLTDEYVPSTPSCGIRKQGRRWFRLWENFTALQEDPTLLPCYADQLRLAYDPAAGDYRNVRGVKTRVVSFGTTRSFRFDDPARKNVCMERLVEALEGVCSHTNTSPCAPGDERDMQDTSPEEPRRERDTQDTPARSLETRNPPHPGGTPSGVRWLWAALAGLTALGLRRR